MTWITKCFNFNENIIEDYDVLKHREDFIKKLKKKYTTREDFAEALKHEMMYHYWSKCEWELIIRLTDDGRVILLPWIGRTNPEDVAVNVTDDKSFDWRGFAKEHIGKQIFDNEAKIDVWDQLFYKWDDFVTYCWNYKRRPMPEKLN